jgi:L-2,4-diaminobutyric acid acetyltransferase
MVEASTLDTNSPYAYLMWFRDFAGTSVLAECVGRPVGFIAGYSPPERPDTRFVWQVCVDPAMRGRGLARRMLKHLAQGIGAPARYIEATVTPGNAASMALFRGFAADAGVPCEETPCFGAELFPGASHEPEHLLRIGPLHSGKHA